MQLEDWLDDLCVRFIINLPPEELASVERICFQVEEAQWFYEDFIRPLDPSLPSLSLKQFSLRIFQHCPLFSQWSTQHHATAFAEFLAYKQRVPVRGAIMLNEAMDEVVLVKGWKKGANWSFPRGKINKDESDLDCAVREVYEETGFDIQAAGLVKPEKEMKHIEVTMREQHMRLYVFRGVPRDTHFEPRTRKEISKIEWYKLTDLPTIKKRAHQEHDEHPAINANKFYMVAPFLHPLKKWITQQRKKEGRYSGSTLAVPPLLAEESAAEIDAAPIHPLPHPNQPTIQGLSSLPEVLPMQAQKLDPSGHLKELLQIGGPPNYPELAPQPYVQAVHVPGADAAKSNALLALLRNAPGTTSQQSSQPPFDEPHFHHQSPMTSKPVQSVNSQFPNQELPLPSNGGQSSTQQPNQQSLLRLFSNASIGGKSVNQAPNYPQPSAAPYSRTGDPHVALDSPDPLTSSAIPPADALPKLTQHTRALLDAFNQPPTSQREISSNLQPAQRSLLDVFRSSSSQVSGLARELGGGGDSQPKELPGHSSFDLESSLQYNASPSNQAQTLLELLKHPSGAASSHHQPKTHQNHVVAPAELAAGPVETPKGPHSPSQSEILAALFRKDKPGQTLHSQTPVVKAGQTGATITAPLNQPSLEVLGKAQQTSEHERRRSPAHNNRTLYDPKQSTPVKILARPEIKQSAPPRSPRSSKNAHATSSTQKSAKGQDKTQEKPFQPQILKRPQILESRQSFSPSPPPTSATLLGSLQPSRRPSNIVSTSSSPNPEHFGQSSAQRSDELRRPSAQPESHRQTLLQLFGGASPLITSSVAQPAAKQIPSIPGTRSPAAQSQLVSPIVDEPISTRSRVGSLASISSGMPGATIVSGVDGRAKVEKRQTAAEDKAFLLGYLGRIANQEG